MTTSKIDARVKFKVGDKFNMPDGAYGPEVVFEVTKVINENSYEVIELS